MDLKLVRQEQLELAKKVITFDMFDKIRKIAGAQVVYTKEKMIAAVAVIDYKTLDVLEKKHYVSVPQFHYRPEYVAYREAPAIVQALSKTESKPDLIMCNSHGIAHPRRIGCASHVGLLLDLPSIGVAKSHLCGQIKDNKIYYRGELRGVLMHTKTHANPIYVSPGHKIGLPSTKEIVRNCLVQNSKMPQPLRIAHKVGLNIKKIHKI